MNVIVFGATGRVGRAFVGKALAAGHSVCAFVREPGALKVSNVALYRGDVRDASAVKQALSLGFDAVIVCIGPRGFAPSTVVTEGFQVIAKAMTELGQRRLIGVSGSAEMPRKTWGGKAYTALLRLTPIGHAVRDHDGGLRALSASQLEWTLAGCNYLPDGPERGRYKTSLIFPGGFKTIRPGDVADFLLEELTRPHFVREVVGIWY